MVELPPPLLVAEVQVVVVLVLMQPLLVADRVHTVMMEVTEQFLELLDKLGVAVVVVVLVLWV